MDLRDLMKLAGLSDVPAPHSNDTMNHAGNDSMKRLMVILDPRETDDDMMEPACGCGCGESPCSCDVQEEVVDEWANSGDHVSGEPEQMTNGHGEMGSAVDTSLRRYLNAKGDHTTVDETVYPDVTVDELAESYASYKSGTVAEGELPPGLKAYQDKKAGKKKPEVSDDEVSNEIKENPTTRPNNRPADAEADELLGRIANHRQDVDHFLNTSNPVIDHPVAAGLRNRQNRVSEGKMKDTVIDDAESMSKEEFSEKHGKETASEYFEESTLDPLAELRKLSGISEAPVTAPSSSDINEFVSGYIDAASWTEEEEIGRATGWSEEGLADMKKDATAFYTKAEELLNSVDGEHGLSGHGHDFWLTRNGHGVGFWDRGYGDAGDKLTDLAQSFGEANIYMGDDNMIYTESTGSSTQESVDTDLDGAIEAAGGDVNSPEAKEIKNRFGK